MSYVYLFYVENLHRPLSHPTLCLMFTRSLVGASLRPLLLSILAGGEAYGYQIIQGVQKLSGGHIHWTTGTLYPLLHRLENEGLITSVWREGEAAPRRKYYALTPKGERALAAEKQQWVSMHAIMMQLWNPAS